MWSGYDPASDDRIEVAGHHRRQRTETTERLGEARQGVGNESKLGEGGPMSVEQLSEETKGILHLMAHMTTKLPEDWENEFWLTYAQQLAELVAGSHERLTLQEQSSGARGHVPPPGDEPRTHGRGGGGIIPALEGREAGRWGMNPGDAVAGFLASMEAAGVRPVEPIAQSLGSGSLIRFRADGDKPGRRNGWAVLHLDGKPAGAFGCYRLGVRERWRAEGSAAVSPAEVREQRRQWREMAEKRTKERQEAQEAASVEAQRLWDSSGPVAASHAYLVRKDMTGEELRQSGDTLLVPMHDVSGRLWNLQRIRPDGFKLFMKGGRTKGLFCLTGEGGNTLCIGEGVATMAAVRRSTGLPVAATFSGENLEPVARLVRRRWPSLDLVICADDDAHLLDHPTIKKNLGLEYAKAAAAAVDGRLAVPPNGGA
jgi:putative DNA primase/helicase